MAKRTKPKRTPSQIGKANQRQGKKGQAEWAKLCRKYGIEARSGREIDCVLPGCHVEVKYREKVNVDDALDQAVCDRGSKIPLVAFREKYERNWTVAMLVENLLDMLDPEGFVREPDVTVQMDAEEWLIEVYVPWAKVHGYLPSGLEELAQRNENK